MKIYLGLLIIFLSAQLIHAKVEDLRSASQVLRVTVDKTVLNKPTMSDLSRQLIVTDNGYNIKDDYSVILRNAMDIKKSKPEDRTLIKRSSETNLSPKFEWKSTRTVQTGMVTKTSQFNMDGKNLLVNIKEDKKPAVTKILPGKSAVLPLSALPYFLFNQGRGQIGIPKNLEVFDTTAESFKKISWVYLGTSTEFKKKIYRFEIKGELSMIFNMDSTGRILKIKDFKNYNEFVDSSVK